MGSPSLSVVMPALNEQAGIGDAVRACAHCAQRLTGRGLVSSVEIVVVDDGSTDRTWQVLTTLAAEDPHLVLRRHDRNRGLGAALRTGFEAASGDLVFYTDADLPVELHAVDRCLELLDDDVQAVAAYRARRTGEGPRRFVYSLAYNWLCRAALGLRVRDVNFAAKLVRGSDLRRLDLRSEGSFIDAELLARLQRGGVGIAQFPATYQPRSKGVSTLSSGSVIVGMLRELRELRPSIRSTGQERVSTG